MYNTTLKIELLNIANILKIAELLFGDVDHYGYLRSVKTILQDYKEHEYE